MQATLVSGTELLPNPHIHKQAFPYRKFYPTNRKSSSVSHKNTCLPIKSNGIAIFITGGIFSSQIVLHLFFLYLAAKSVFFINSHSKLSLYSYEIIIIKSPVSQMFLLRKTTQVIKSLQLEVRDLILNN